MKRFFVLCLSAAGAVYASAFTVTGDFVIATPPDVSSSPSPAVSSLDVFAESANVSVASNSVVLDATAPGFVNTFAQLAPSNLAAGTYNSFFICYAPQTETTEFYQGTVHWGRQEIVGVQVVAPTLNTGSVFENAGVYYGSSFSGSDGLELTGSADSFEISADRHTFSVAGRVSIPGDRIRVITEQVTPEPASLSILGLGAFAFIRKRRSA